MTGRGVDQILRHPSGHQLFEPYVRDARDYVQLAEARNGPIAKPVTGSYIWGDALAELDRVAPAVRIINLETSITTSDAYWKGKSDIRASGRADSAQRNGVRTASFLRPSPAAVDVR